MVDRKANEGKLDNDTGNMKIVNTPKEIKILGKISRVYVEGNELHQEIIFDKKERQVTQEYAKKRNKHYIIVPFEDKNSAVQFIKVPIYKLEKKPKAKNVGPVSCQRINPFGERCLTDELDKWSALKKELQPMEKLPRTVMVPIDTGPKVVREEQPEKKKSNESFAESEHQEVHTNYESEQPVKTPRNRNPTYASVDNNGLRILPSLVTTKAKQPNKSLFKKKNKMARRNKVTDGLQSP